MVTKTADEDTQSRISSIQSQLDEAIAAEATAQDVREKIAGLNILGEISPGAPGRAEEALSKAQRHTSALRSAIAVLAARQTAQDAQKEQERIGRLRDESKAAETAQTKALAMVAKSAGTLSDALQVVKAQNAVLDGLHAALVAGDPITDSEVREDYRDAVAAIERTMETKRAGIRQAASSAQYRLQAPSNGIDATVEQVIPLLDGAQVVAGTRYSAARPAVLTWEADALLALEDQHREMMVEAFQEHSARVEVAGLGSLACSIEEVRAGCAALDMDALAMVVPDRLARDLAGLLGFLPASASEGIAIRSVPRSALEARTNESRLQAGVKAIQALIGH